MDKKNVAALVIVAVLVGFVLGRLSTRIDTSRGEPEIVDSNLAKYVEDDPGELAEASDLLRIEDAPFLGRGAAKVTMVLFTEFQCPYSRRVLGSLMELLDEYEGDELRLVFMNFPLDVHELAQPAASAALSAHDQGQFWPYHDLLFNNQNAFDDRALESYAEQLGLQIDVFRAAQEGDGFTSRIANEQATGSVLGVRGTPSFLINGQLVVGAKPASEFRALIDDEIREADELLAEGASLTEIHRLRVAFHQRQGEQGSRTDEPTEARGATARNAQQAPEPVHLEVFADFTDPQYQPLARTLARLTSELGNTLDVDFTSVVDTADEQAVLLAAALRAASAQRSWGPYHAALINTDGALDLETLLAIARGIGLDQARFHTVLESPDLAQLATAETESAQRRGVVATPAIFFRGRRFVGSIPYSDLRELIDAELAQR